MKISEEEEKEETNINANIVCNIKNHFGNCVLRISDEVTIELLQAINITMVHNVFLSLDLWAYYREFEHTTNVKLVAMYG
jgi:hypothetical protein